MYSAMGVGTVALIGMPVVVARVALRDTASGMGPAMRAGIWRGARTSFALTLIVAGTMSAGGGHWVGVPSAGAATIPFFGWSAEEGALRPAHFLSLHALQGLPLAGLWLDRYGRSRTRLPPLAVVWAGITVAVFGQALLGLPLVRL